MDVSKQTKSYNCKAIDWLDSNDKINEILVTAYAYIKIKQLISKELPEYLKNSFHVININQNSITIAVDNAIYATRIRQLSHSILNEINYNYNRNIETLKIRIINISLTFKTKHIHEQKNNISNKSLKFFEKLQYKSKPGPLKDAIQRLIEHHKSYEETG